MRSKRTTTRQKKRKRKRNHTKSIKNYEILSIPSLFVSYASLRVPRVSFYFSLPLIKKNFCILTLVASLASVQSAPTAVAVAVAVPAPAPTATEQPEGVCSVFISAPNEFARALRVCTPECFSRAKGWKRVRC